VPATDTPPNFTVGDEVVEPPPEMGIVTVWKPVPVIVTPVPPSIEPVLGLTEVTVTGGGAV
jgi:hypothetical protein